MISYIERMIEGLIRTFVLFQFIWICLEERQHTERWGDEMCLWRILWLSPNLSACLPAQVPVQVSECCLPRNFPPLADLSSCKRIASIMPLSDWISLGNLVGKWSFRWEQNTSMIWKSWERFLLFVLASVSQFGRWWHRMVIIFCILSENNLV